MLGEITPAMSVAVGQSSATKLLLQVNSCRNLVIGTQQMTLTQIIAQTVAQLAAMAS